MTHQDIAPLVEAYLDDELAAADARELEAHLAQCSDCARFRADREALRAAIKGGLPRFEAPETLRERVQAAVRAASAEGAHRRPSLREWWRPLALAASLGAVALGSWRLALRQVAGETVAGQVLASHVRSLMPGHLTDVLSSDQHTVKPWFNGRLDFSPPVYDLSEQGYPLVGGRLDYLNGRAVAALVYGRRQHLINLFLWSASNGSSPGPPSLTRQGYHLLHWSAADYTYWIVSDLDLQELRAFVGLLQAKSATRGP